MRKAFVSMSECSFSILTRTMHTNPSSAAFQTRWCLASIWHFLVLLCVFFLVLTAPRSSSLIEIVLLPKVSMMNVCIRRRNLVPLMIYASATCSDSDDANAITLCACENQRIAPSPSITAPPPETECRLSRHVAWSESTYAGIATSLDVTPP